MAKHLDKQLKVVKRNSSIVSYSDARVADAAMGAMISSGNNLDVESSDKLIKKLVKNTRAALENDSENGLVTIDDVVRELIKASLREGLIDMVYEYILYSSQHDEYRSILSGYRTTDEMGTSSVLNSKALVHRLSRTVSDVITDKQQKRSMESLLVKTVAKQLYNDITHEELNELINLSTRSLLVTEPDFQHVAGYNEVLTVRKLADKNVGDHKLIPVQPTASEWYRHYFRPYIEHGVELGLLDSDLLEVFDLPRLAAAIRPDRDKKFAYLGISTLRDRYFVRDRKQNIIEAPQALFMRVAMGVNLLEGEDATEKAISFYNLLSNFDFMPSTPTLFNAGTASPQLSSCYLATIPDDLEGIFQSFGENAMLSKFAGGIANDVTRIRALGSHIKGTNGQSQGTIPFIKIINDTALAVNQCFEEGTRILTTKGYKKIEDVEPKDVIMSKNGLGRKVIRKYKHRIRDASMHKVRTHIAGDLTGKQDHPISVTSNPIGRNKFTGNRLGSIRGKIEWRDLGDVRSDDWVVIPIPKVVEGIRTAEDEAIMFFSAIASCRVLRRTENGFQLRLHKTKVNSSMDLSRMAKYLEIYNVNAELTETDSELVVELSSLGQYSNEYITSILEEPTAALPKWAFSSEIVATKFITGMLANTRWEIAHNGTVELMFDNYLARDMVSILLLRQGIPSEDTPDTDNYHLRVPLTTFVARGLRTTPKNIEGWFTDGGNIYVSVDASHGVIRDPKAYMYDLGVEGDPSYAANNFLVHNGGRRRGAICAYMEIWHADFFDFLDLRKNTGDERRRAHDIDSAAWIPDLFMERVHEDGDWWMFSPDEVPELHDAYGEQFKQHYERYEQMAEKGELLIATKVSAKSLWRKLLSSLYSTGHPWVTFKDPSNIRYPNAHAGVIHSSNLCTEIIEHSSDTETAVCNLGSLNLTKCVVDKVIDEKHIRKVIQTATRALDNVIDINFYPIKKASTSNNNFRPIGIGVLGWHETLQKSGIAVDSEEAVELADKLSEIISYCAIEASMSLAKEKGAYPGFKGSLWSKGTMPIDTVNWVRDSRGPGYFKQDNEERLDWDKLRKGVAEHGIRNSNLIAIAPTATIANICGVSQGIDPYYLNVYTKSNLSGEFLSFNMELVRRLKKANLWDQAMRDQLLRDEGSVQNNDRIPDDIKVLFKTAFEIDPEWLIRSASARQKWVDQSQSLNLFIDKASGKKLDRMYKSAWLHGLKTTYYLKAFNASSTTDTTVEDRDSNLEPVAQAPSNPDNSDIIETAIKQCRIDDPTCESCQ